MRVTTGMVFHNSLDQLRRQRSRLFEAQEEAVSGKRLQRPSDDPVGTRTVLNTRQQLTALEQSARNRQKASTVLQATEDALDGFTTVLTRAKELAIQGANDTLNAEDRQAIANEVEELFAQAVQLGNSDITGRYLFAGQQHTQAPVTSDGQFSGDGKAIELALYGDQQIAINVSGDRFLSSDVRPGISASTPLSSLRDGAGITAGSIQITDRAGNAAVINLAAATTVGDVLTAISGTAGIHVTASLSATGDSIVLTDTNTTPTGDLRVAEVGAGTTASELGIAVERSGNIQGTPLHAVLTTSTPLASLNGGAGGAFTSLHISNGTAEVDVDLTTAVTIGDVLTAINASAANVTASIRTDGRGLDIVSNDATTVAVAADVDGGSSAVDLGLQGAHDVLTTLQLLQTALERNDRQGVDNLLRHIDAGLNQVLELRGEVGARLQRIELVDQAHADTHLTLKTVLSQTEDADAVESLTRFSQLSTAFEAALGATARIIQPTLLDFLR